MMSGRIYLLQENGSLQAMSERSYVTEERLQVLLGDYPDLLAGDQMDKENPRRWLLVSREIGVPVEEGGGDWMSLDHLFLDQDAIPTLVEVKRSSATRLRRGPCATARRRRFAYSAREQPRWLRGGGRAGIGGSCATRRTNNG